MHSGVNAKGFEGNQMLFGADQFTMVFALLGNRIVQVYTVKDLREYLLLDLYYANFVPDFSKDCYLPLLRKDFPFESAEQGILQQGLQR